jgi:hypothetical protein
MLTMDFRVSNKIFGQEMIKISYYQNPLALAMVLLCELCSLRMAGVCYVSTWYIPHTVFLFQRQQKMEKLQSQL